MKKRILITLIIAIILGGILSAQSTVKGISANGITGLITTPTARIGWEKSDLGLDLGYSMMSDDNDTTHIPRVTLSLFKKFEVAAAYAMGEVDGGIMLNGKFQFYKNGGSSFAAGLDYSTYDYDTNTQSNDPETLLRPYFVATYGGNFFDTPAVTSVTFGWDLDEGDGMEFDNFNYSMGFELSLFPKTLKNFAFLITDFANYNFSRYSGASGVNANSRGIFNAGIRLDPMKSSEYKLIIDIIGTDMLDPNRGLMLDATFGLAL